MFDEKRPEYVNEIIVNDKHYVILASAGWVIGERSAKYERNIEGKWMEWPGEVEKLGESECVPKTKDIVNITIANHFKCLK